MKQHIDYIALGQRIREARKARGLSQEKLGELCGISTAHVGHIERGTRVPSAEVLFQLSTELHVSMDYLFFDSPSDGEPLLKSISARLNGKDPEKAKTFFKVVKVLADKIDDL